VHLNDEGRARFSAYLGQRLNEQVMAKSSQ